jgi:hypothetical protein
MTTGAKVGIGIGSAALVSIAMGTFFVFRRRHAKKVMKPLPESPQRGYQDEANQNTIHEVVRWENHHIPAALHMSCTVIIYWKRFRNIFK